MERWIDLDHRLSSQAGALVRASRYRWLAVAWAHSGDSPIWLIIGAGLWRLAPGAWAGTGAQIIAVTLLAFLLSTALKSIFRRAGPVHQAGQFYLDLDQHSFPSGHATRIGGLIVVLGHRLSGWGLAILLLWGLGVCISRVALQLHYASDIAVGLFFGLAAGALLLQLGML